MCLVQIYENRVCCFCSVRSVVLILVYCGFVCLGVVLVLFSASVYTLYHTSKSMVPPAQNNLPNDSEDDFYDAFDSPPPVATHMMDPMQSYSDMNDSCMLFQSHDHLGGLSWAQEEGGLLDEGAGEAAFAEDLTIVRNGPGNPHVAWLPTVMQPT